MTKSNSEKSIETLSPESSPNLWERRSDTAVQLWTKGSKEHSLIKPTVPLHLGLVGNDLNDDISAPPPYSYSIFEKLGIIHAAINEMKPGFKTYRYRQNFHFVIFVLWGEISLVSKRQKLRATKGDLLIIPACSDYEIRTSKGWKTCWAHIKKSKEWDGLVGSQIRLKKSLDPEKLRTAMNLCLLEVHSPRRSCWTINLCAYIICAHIRMELGDSAEKPEMCIRIEEILLSDPAKIPTAQKASKKLGIPVTELDRICLRKFGGTYSRQAKNIKMEAAKNMLLRGYPIDKAAEFSGYANRRSFGRAFARECGTTPRAFVRTVV